MQRTEKELKELSDRMANIVVATLAETGLIKNRDVDKAADIASEEIQVQIHIEGI